MNTPIYDFLKNYAARGAIRMHMPGHKGRGNLGIEHLDITEICGADSLYEADGIISESEKNAGEIFSSDTFYSTEGSSLVIRAMLYLAALHARDAGRAPHILAPRCAHKSFVSAAALLDFKLSFLPTKKEESYLSSRLDAEELDSYLNSLSDMPTAFYITTPDYLGGLADIEAISRVTKKYEMLLLVDNAHGAYLKFLTPSRHPIDLGADMCSDSAHKTLPALTGAAYLHISKNAPKILSENAKSALSLFGSTSPSYLTLASLDRLNCYLKEGYREKLSEFLPVSERAKRDLMLHGYTLFGDEPLKITILAKEFGYTGLMLSKILEDNGIFPEFADPDFLTLMLSPECKSDLEKTVKTLISIEKKLKILDTPPHKTKFTKKLSIREAMLSPCERIPTEKALFRILAQPSVGCPPAVPIIFAGEVIDEEAISAFNYYNIRELTVVKN